NEPLLKVDHDYNIVPGLLAEVPSLENGGISPDFLTYTLRLRSGLVWEDGVPITANDIAFTWQWLNDPVNVAYATHGWEKVVSVAVGDDGLTAVVTLADTFAFWLDEAVIGMGIAPQHAVEAAVTKDAFNQRPVGNGPFKLAEWRIGDVLIFERNDNYYRGPAYLDRVVVRIIPDSNALTAALIAGDVNIAIGLLTANVPQLQAASNTDVTITTWPQVERIFFSQTVAGDPSTPHPILTDVAVRKALIISVDMDEILENLYFGINPRGINELYGTGYFNDELSVYPFDPDEARRTLEAAGWIDRDGDGIREKDGVRLSLTHSTTAGNRPRESMQAIMQQAWADVGIEVTIENYPAPSFFGGWNGVAWGRRYEMAQFSNGIFALQPNLSDWWHSDAIPTPEKQFGNGHSGWSNARVDELLDEHRRGVTDERAREILNEVQRIIYDDYAMFPLFSAATIFGVNRNVHNVNPTQFGAQAGLFWDVFDWWVD
ncbi:MAG: peptide ABC transporter substrate-binding protein, partial [Trueperaceae bacterium]|nr:peptide ABC transporter substrate-binding protein [Trueperaceae bacterium]